MKKSLKQRLRESDPGLVECLERLTAPLHKAMKEVLEAAESNPQPLQDANLNPSFYIHEQACERTPAFKQYHEKTGGDLDDFMGTPEGETDPAIEKLFSVVEAFHSSPPPVIYVIPRFYDGRYLFARIDLSKSKDALRSEFEKILRIHHDWVEHPRVPRGEKWPDSMEEINRIFHAYDLVERHKGNYLKATHELYPETNGKYPHNDCETDRHMQQVKRWHQKVERFIAALQHS